MKVVLYLPGNKSGSQETMKRKTITMNESIYPGALKHWRRPSKKRLQKLKQILEHIQPLKGMLFDQCWDCFPSAEMHEVAAEVESKLDWLRDHIIETLRKHGSSVVASPQVRDQTVNLRRLLRRYKGLRVERHHGEMIACGVLFPAAEIKKGQRWQGTSGHKVTIESVDAHSVYYSWMDRGNKRMHDKSHFAFQCRYCLILLSS